jgi:predicted nucleic acid-binding protein
MRIYLDLCCLQRPLDDQSQARIRIESEAVRLIVELCGYGKHQWVSSRVLEFEATRNPDEDRRGRVLALLKHADERIALADAAVERATNYQRQGLRGIDALHLAAAEAAACDVLLTTDDRFVRRVRELRPGPKVRVENPAQWVVEHAEDDS